MNYFQKSKTIVYDSYNPANTDTYETTWCINRINIHETKSDLPTAVSKSARIILVPRHVGTSYTQRAGYLFRTTNLIVSAYT